MSSTDLNAADLDAPAEPEGYQYSAPNPLAAIRGINPQTLSPGYASSSVPEPDYLNYDIKGRGWTEKTFLNVGTTYLSGILLGGAYGFFEGLSTSPSNKFKIRLNSVLNACGRRGSRVGNAIGSLALMFSLTDAFLERGLHLDEKFKDVFKDNHFSAEVSTPVLSGMVTGLMYKSTMGLKTMSLAGVMGGGLVFTVEAARHMLNYR
eukprot:snap_masked-scaffold_4-processed-gene-16.43-mRNA-1 protein AED:0.08 eAED:0.08 QI:0/-1/0/1/-1/1/1/0/205